MSVYWPIRCRGALIRIASLREADRVLIDDGWLILSGFNPVSLNDGIA